MKTITHTFAPQMPPVYSSAGSPDLHIKPTARTPYVRLSHLDDKLVIKGSATALDLEGFYAPIISRVQRHLRIYKKLRVQILFDDLNASTAKFLFDFFKTLRNAQMAGAQIDVTWAAPISNFEMLETGRDFADLYDLNFRIVPVS